MRNDLTPNFLVKMSGFSREPIQVCVFHFNSGDVYLADRDIVISGIPYDGLIEDWGELGTVGDENGISGTMDFSLSIWNGGDYPFSDYFLDEEPTNVFVEVFQTFEGLEESDFALIGEFVIQDPIEFNEVSSLIRIDLVTSNMRYFGKVGKVLTKTDFPNALTSDLNKPIDFIVGNAGRVQCLCSDKPPVTTLDRSIVRTTITIEVNDNLDEKNFPQSGRIQINGELINYSSRGEYYFTASQRGYNSLPTDHAANSEVILSNKTVDYIIGQLPIAGIDNILVNGLRTSLFSSVIEDTENNVAILRFLQQPTYEDTNQIVSENVYFDTTLSGNTAQNPHYAYSQNYRSKGALITKVYDRLSIANYNDQITENADGEIVNVFLKITSWATKPYTAENLQVFVSDIGAIGYLSKPDEAAKLSLIADTDIDHPHIHVTTKNPTNTFSKPSVLNTDPKHPHSLNATTQKTKSGSPYTYSMGIQSNGAYGETKEVDIWFYDLTKEGFGALINLNVITRLSGNATLQFIDVITEWGDDVSINSFGPEGINGAITVNGGDWSTSYSNQNYKVTVRAGFYVNNGSAYLDIMGSTISYGSPTKNVNSSLTGVNANLNNDGYVVTDPYDTDGKLIRKQDDDVNELAIDNRLLNVDDESSELYTQPFTDIFDLSDFKTDIDWDFLQDLFIRVVFNGSGDVGVYVTWAEIQVDYRKPILKTTDDITCEVSGYSENRPDAVVQYLLTEKAGVPVEKLGSVYRDLPKWDDTETWDDSEIWSDGGQVDNVPEGAYFEEAAAWFSFKDYTIDGVIPGNKTIKDAIQDITWQTRSKITWQNGLCKLSILRKSENWLIAKDIDVNSIQLASYRSWKSQAADIINRIDIFHTIDRLSSATGPGKYEGTSSIIDNQSIQKHGDKSNDDLWLFYLIRNQTIADDIADFYIWLLGEPRTYYQFATYLNNFDLEKEDYVTISSTRFARLLKLPVVIKDIKRSFGSGKLEKINLLKLISESIRHYIFNFREESFVFASDSLNVEFGFEIDLENTVGTEDAILFLWQKFFEESINVSDSYELIVNYNPSFTEDVTVSEDTVFDLEIYLEDDIIVYDDLNIAQELCFGACGFGAPNCEIPFGSVTQHNELTTEVLKIVESSNFEIGVGLDDDVEIQDSLIISNGFGCPNGLGDGFSNTPFGC